MMNMKNNKNIQKIETKPNELQIEWFWFPFAHVKLHNTTTRSSSHNINNNASNFELHLTSVFNLQLNNGEQLNHHSD